MDIALESSFTVDLIIRDSASLTDELIEANITNHVWYITYKHQQPGAQSRLYRALRRDSLDFATLALAAVPGYRCSAVVALKIARLQVFCCHCPAAVVWLVEALLF